MNIYLTVHVQDLDSSDFDYAIYKAARRLLEKHEDKYIPGAPSEAIVHICKELSDNADKLFDTNFGYSFDMDFAGEDIEEASIEKLISFITKTLIKMFRDDIIYIVHTGNVLQEVESAVEDGDMVLFKSPNYAVLFNSRGYSHTIIYE